MGRWRAETVQSGYWIIDRFSDGRYARKYFLNHNYAKPAEVLISWGRWEYNGGVYREIIDGSTSDFINGLSPKWRDVEVDRLERDSFHFQSQEGYPRKEFRVSGKRPLSRLRMNEPKAGDGRWVPSKHGVVETQQANLPEWIENYPR